MPTHHANGTALPERMTYGFSFGGVSVGSSGVSVSVGGTTVSTDDIDVDPLGLIEDGCTSVGCIRNVINDEFVDVVESKIEDISEGVCETVLDEINLKDTGVCPIVGDTFGDLLMGRFDVDDIMGAVKQLLEMVKAQLADLK